MSYSFSDCRDYLEFCKYLIFKNLSLTFLYALTNPLLDDRTVALR